MVQSNWRTMGGYFLSSHGRSLWPTPEAPIPVLKLKLPLQLLDAAPVDNAIDPLIPIDSIELPLLGSFEYHGAIPPLNCYP